MSDELSGIEQIQSTTGTGATENGSATTDPSLLSATLNTPVPPKEGEPAGAPEKYSDFTAPEGVKLDPAVIAEAAPLFKELGLSQAAAQRLVDFHLKNTSALVAANDAAFKATRTEWVESLKSDPVLGKELGPGGKVQRAVNGALETLQNPKLVADFKEAMDSSGMGDNPAFVRVMYALASKLTEGTYVQGQPTGAKARPSAAAAIFPSLPSAGG